MSLVVTECSDLLQHFDQIFYRIFLWILFNFIYTMCVFEHNQWKHWQKWENPALSKMGSSTNHIQTTHCSFIHTWRDYSETQWPYWWTSPLHVRLSTNILLLISYLLPNCVLYFFLALYIPPHQMHWVICHSSGEKNPITCLASMSHCIPNLIQYYVGIVILSKAFVIYYGLAPCDLYWILLPTPFYVCLSGFQGYYGFSQYSICCYFFFFNQK